MSPPWIEALIVLSFLLGSVWLYKRNAARAKLPPFVRGLPIIGNLHQMLSLSHLQVSRWKKVYGPIFTIDVAGQFIVVVADVKSAVGLLDKKSAVTAGRPPLRVVNDIALRNQNVAVGPFGERWRKHRRAAHESLAGSSAQTYVPVQQDEALLLAKNLLESYKTVPLERHTYAFIASALWRAFYGQSPRGLEGEANIRTMNELIDEVMRLASPKCPEALADRFPFLLDLPASLLPWRKLAEEYYARSNSFYMGLANETLQRMKLKEAAADSNIISDLDARKTKLGITTTDIAWLAGATIAGGGETTSSTLQYFILAMLLYPAVAARAQAELDQVVGLRHPPTLEDRERLPYIEAIAKEVMRWRPVLPLGVPHSATEDLHYSSYVIPKGTTILPSQWDVCHDPEVYSDPDTFNPDRFLTSNTTSGRYADFGLGFGRRICLGKDFAMNGLFIAMSVLLWAFEFRTEDGMELKEELNDRGLTVKPERFPYELGARSETIVEYLKGYRSVEV